MIWIVQDIESNLVVDPAAAYNAAALLGDTGC
jgi:hypothetical protein